MRWLFFAFCLYSSIIFGITQKNLPVIIDQAQLTDQRLPCNRGDKKFCDLRIYQIMVESFVNGDPHRGFGAGYGHSHHRGDLQGIINSLDYIRSLNVNAIWLTPIFDTDADGDSGDQLRLDATGYFAHDYFKIDPHFGSLAQAQELVQKAHRHGLQVFFDGVFGHTKISGVAPSPTGLIPKLRSCGKEYVDYPGLCAQYPQSRAFFAEVAAYWIHEAGIDGWRVDQAYQVPVADWHDIQEQAPGYYVAEIWRGKPEGLTQEIQREAFGTITQPGLMSAFDFPVRYALMQVLATEEDATKPNASHQPAALLNGPNGMGSHAIYPDFAIPNLMIGNHDTVRFGNLIMRAGIAKPDQTDYWQLHRLAFAFLTAYSGPITIYYGDEIGDFIPHFSQKITRNCVSQGLCDDHVSRTDAKILGVTVQNKDLDPRAIQLKNYVTQLMLLKANHPALFSGARTHLGSGVDYYVDLKTLNSEKIIFIMNISKNPQTFLIKSSLIGSHDMLRDLLTAKIFHKKNQYFSITVPALDSKFLIAV